MSENDDDQRDRIIPAFFSTLRNDQENPNPAAGIPLEDSAAGGQKPANDAK